MSRSPTRRALLLGAVGVVAATACGERSAAEARTVTGWLASAHLSKRAGWTIAYPPGHGPEDRLPVVVSLHGRGATHRTTFTTLGLGTVLDDLVDDGVAPFALASVDGGDHGYWHPRADGTDAGAMVMLEFLPMLRERGLDTDRLGLYGWSMGGYGALLLVGHDHVPVRAVAVSSPALFTSAGGTPAGAFDSAGDYTRNDVYGHPEWLDGVPLRVDCGRSDPFYAATRDFVSKVRPHPQAGFESGGHDAAYWRTVAPTQLGFLGRHLDAL
jgi:enterochelin esterase-like enzyme